MTELTYISPEMTVSLFEEADVLTASGETYESNNIGNYESRDAGEFDDFDIDWD